ncbi:MULTISPECIES: helix-turn-helix domain-containing protein [unclassified Serratia (in: enterobacteria)]|uniref:winged helix-turn-helix domain-containing protein n=1 Tax=unclassified Serratia (in: enterobacteria) TaxID=2647522 RepID=UPI0012FEF00B|nr:MULTISPECIES: helix-turn-helix domain-containing protein [unclassified Serratia (in: enterobacteria)]
MKYIWTVSAVDATELVMDSKRKVKYAATRIINVGEKNLSLFGYIIDDQYQVDIKSSSVIKLYNTIECSHQPNGEFTNYLKLRETMLRLLNYLLAHASVGYVSNQELLVQVWENHNLSSSTTRLMQVISELKSRLEKIGLANDFIKASRGKGYTLRGASITPLYIKTT